jgi:hypothetical protein
MKLCMKNNTDCCQCLEAAYSLCKVLPHKPTQNRLLTSSVAEEATVAYFLSSVFLDGVLPNNAWARLSHHLYHILLSSHSSYPNHGKVTTYCEHHRTPSTISNLSSNSYVQNLCSRWQMQELYMTFIKCLSLMCVSPSLGSCLYFASLLCFRGNWSCGLLYPSRLQCRKRWPGHVSFKLPPSFPILPKGRIGDFFYYYIFIHYTGGDS